MTYSEMFQLLGETPHESELLEQGLTDPNSGPVQELDLVPNSNNPILEPTVEPDDLV